MRVLIVDDAAKICWAHEKMLRLLGHDALALIDGRNALAEAKKFHPDVILIDLCMPYMDGWDVAKQLRADPETLNMRLVAVTAMMSPDFERHSADSGFDAHVGKPVHVQDWPGILSGTK
jgi:CheY-like chemotaxis protein